MEVVLIEFIFRILNKKDFKLNITITWDRNNVSYTFTASKTKSEGIWIILRKGYYSDNI